MTRHRSVPLRVPILLAAAGALAGCGGHGKHTGKFLEERQEKMAQMRAATTYDLAQQAFFAGELEKSLRHLDDSIALSDGVAKSHVLRGRVLMEMGDLAGAIRSLEHAESLNPSNVDAQYFLALTHERASDKPRALARFMRAAELDPANPQYLVAAAETLVDLGRVAEARTLLESHLDSLGHAPGVVQTLGHVALIEGDAERATELFGEGRLLAPGDQGIIEDLARAQMLVGDFAQAEYNLATLLEKPGAASRRDLKHMRAQCLLKVGRPVEARAILLALTNDAAGQSDLRAWIELGNVAFELRDMNRVRQASQRVQALAPDRSEGHLLRALWQRHRGDLPAALQSANLAVERRGAEISPLLLRGLIQREMGDLSGARASFRLAQTDQPENAQIRTLLALVESEQLAAAGN
jgi:Flp pilus assembly protein TadD